jgi:hypothetical protein
MILRSNHPDSFCLSEKVGGRLAIRAAKFGPKPTTLFEQ